MSERLIVRAPVPALRPFVSVVWATRDARVDPGAREHVLPSGAMHLVVRLAGPALRLFAADADPRGRDVGHAIVGGARAGFYVRDTTGPHESIGAQLRPGAAELLFGAPADELAERHTPLECLWGSAAGRMRERLLDVAEPGRRLDRFESELAARLPAVRALHPAVALALARLQADTDVGAIVRESGYSHRHFIALFRRAVGLGPKRYGRVRRFRDALGWIAGAPETSLAALAHEAGYSDQAHLTREFREFTGVSPAAYRAAAPRSPHHLPVRRRRR